ncbi:NYN domain-containing protein [Candidatus Methanomassiliicoccus intestinalis]|jgi:hypothetical protein|uniref:HTH OST-type domain-containing protein n=2 Tax=Candidatus Methanomassiliicoccus intestinalis TaxID=1406512 RepID=R9T443_METII|nr:NYN domain-containing protein [Candidatus Methanomassiliicoccus intestinalis]AGN25505.1 hypothetical protein MMINT_00950 [Candidatus Methanomassiliicoccus intestinalis Issoire-Mx1]TQS81944.1 MAG: hypothetical protein A3206_08785 [Candidatus Methanomassiliicoccus intestinalis]TQS83401.1 MAG: hypothetical protein A3207_08805 [Candidatus Methanomassiliicoccus intestinalis]
MDEKRIDDRKLAFLVDGDNASAAYVEEMLAEASKYGSVIIRRVYGNWTVNGQVNSWKLKLKEYALIPYQQFPNISNRHITKNTTDIALIIDAMDILHDGIVNGFVIVSSDSDYTSLAIRIREHGIFVMGIGKKDTHDSFRRACDVFVSTENLGKDEEEDNKGISENSGSREKKQAKDAIDLLCRAFEYAVNDDGMALNGDIGAALRRLDPAFDTRTYGESSLLSLIEKLGDIFEVERYDRGAIYIRRKDGRKVSTCEEEIVPMPPAKQNPIDALPILIQAYTTVDKNRDGTVDTYHLFKAARRLDPKFDSINYGKEKISHLLEALPEYFTLSRRGKAMMVMMVDDSTSEEEETVENTVEEIADELVPEEDVKEEVIVEEVRPAKKKLSQIDALKIVKSAFDSIVKDDGRVYLPRLSREVGAMAPDLDFNDFEKKGIKEFIEEFDDVFTLIKEGRTVYVERRKGRRPKRSISEFSVE